MLLAGNLGHVPRERQSDFPWSHRRRARACLRSHSYRRRIQVPRSSGAQGTVAEPTRGETYGAWCSVTERTIQARPVPFCGCLLPIASLGYTPLIPAPLLAVLGPRARSQACTLSWDAVFDWPKLKAAATVVDVCARELGHQLRLLCCHLWTCRTHCRFHHSHHSPLFIAHAARQHTVIKHRKRITVQSSSIPHSTRLLRPRRLFVGRPSLFLPDVLGPTQLAVQEQRDPRQRE